MAGEEPQETGHRHGYDRVSLGEPNEAGPGGANQVEKKSTGVDARLGEWKRAMSTLVRNFRAIVTLFSLPPGPSGFKLVAKAVAALASGAFGYSTGAVIEVSGGMNIRRL